jgi:hypothetical protein
MQQGVAVGLSHPFECFANYSRYLDCCMPSHTDVLKHEQIATDVLIAFMKGTACCPEEEADFKDLTPEKLGKIIEQYYKDRRKLLLESKSKDELR